MTTPAKDEFWALTEKEKQTLRLIVRGHDAKSSARSLGLSVHTVNERLRDARRKMTVSSSREAARMLLEAEGGTTLADPDLFGDTRIGEDAAGPPLDKIPAPIGVWSARRRPRIIIGVLVMTLALGFLALVALPQAAPNPPPPVSTAVEAEAADTARQWLALLDKSDWVSSYRATGKAFRTLNTLQVWTRASERARAPLGAMLSRTLLSQDDVPAPPAGYQVVKFRTRFANKADAIETVTLERQDGAWRIVGVYVG